MDQIDCLFGKSILVQQNLLRPSFYEVLAEFNKNYIKDKLKL